jgi:predicted ATPase
MPGDAGAGDATHVQPVVDPVRRVLGGQRALGEHAWPAEIGPLLVRMAIHCGSAERRDGDYFGPTLNRAARLLAIGHGGQVLLSGATAALVADDLPAGCRLVDRGEHRLRDMDRLEHVHQLAGPGLRLDFPPLRSTAPVDSHLPVQVTSFVGRTRELAEVRRLLGSNRLVTLVGVGGTGKTRLMHEVAGAVADRYRDGARLVELAPVGDPALVVPEILGALGAQPSPGQPALDAAVDFLRAKELLLLLDNCEHLVGAAADATHRLLAVCPGLSILATSREGLGVEGEAIFSVPSLSLPDAIGTRPTHAPEPADLERAVASDAVRLFVERATATLPSFVLDADGAPAVVEICRRLDGIPLALELAAARVNVLSVTDIAQGLGDRFRLLTGGRRTAVPRQQTLQALIDWSWDLLDDGDRRLLRRLSVFAGGWTLEAAAAIAADPPMAPEAAWRGLSATARLETLDGLGRLVDRSLVVVDRDGSTRYRMLETIRQYANERLVAAGEAVPLRDRHLAAFRRLALDGEDGLQGPDMVAWLAKLDPEADNLRTAFDWAFDAHPQSALEMAVALLPYFRSRAVGAEGIDALSRAADLAPVWLASFSPDPGPARLALGARVVAGSLLASAAYHGIDPGENARQEAVAMARASGDRVALLDALIASATAGLISGGFQGAGDAAVEAAQELAVVAESLGRWDVVAMAEAGLAFPEVRRDPAAAERRFDRAIDAARRSGNPYTIANMTQMRGRAAAFTGRLTDARRWFAESIELFTSFGDHRFANVARSELAHALRHAGLLDEAETAYRATIQVWLDGGNRGAIANQLESFAFLRLARGEAERAARLLGAAEAIRDVASAPMTDFEREEYDARVGELRAALGEAALATAWAVGRAMSVNDAVALARAPTGI